MEIARFQDDIWPLTNIENERYTVRCILVNQDHKYGFIHIVGKDEFGNRDHLETIGGGIEIGETKEEALIREVKEETGLTVSEYQELGEIVDTYNLLKRETHSTFFYCLVNSNNQGLTNRTTMEKSLFKEIVWLDESLAIKELENYKCDIGKLVQQRDLKALKFYLKKSIKPNT